MAFPAWKEFLAEVGGPLLESVELQEVNFVVEASSLLKLHDIAHRWWLRRVFCPHLTDAVGPIVQGIVNDAGDGMVRRVCNRHQLPIGCGIDFY